MTLSVSLRLSLSLTLSLRLSLRLQTLSVSFSDSLSDSVSLSDSLSLRFSFSLSLRLCLTLSLSLRLCLSVSQTLSLSDSLSLSQTLIPCLTLHLFLSHLCSSVPHTVSISAPSVTHTFLRTLISLTLLVSFAHTFLIVPCFSSSSSPLCPDLRLSPHTPTQVFFIPLIVLLRVTLYFIHTPLPFLPETMLLSFFTFIYPNPTGLASRPVALTLSGSLSPFLRTLVPPHALLPLRFTQPPHLPCPFAPQEMSTGMGGWG